jgi:NAD(P)-dependent dehydrogenase (short-subunit alcohol dehydrogenase family)
MKLFNLSKESIFITGASGFLGLQYSKFLCDQGAKVYAVDLNENKKILNLKKKYKNFNFHKCNITNEKNLIDLSNKWFKKTAPTVLINNAALDFSPDDNDEFIKPFEKYSNEAWNKAMDVNVNGVYLCCKIIGSKMANKKRGSIINVSSIYGIVSPDPKIYENKNKNKKFIKPIPYSVSKSAIINLTKYLAVYWAKKNVRVNNLILGGMQNKQNKTFIKNYSNRVPFGRMAKINEYNGPILFLSSNLSSYMTGSNLVIDGGWTAI